MDIAEIRKMKNTRKVIMLTAYDYQMARILDQSGVDIILVGDSLGTVILGHEGTKQVTMADMVRHIEAVSKGTNHALVVGDMPINTYNTVESALLNARKLIEAGAQAVKIEGYKPKVLNALISSGIPVMGHVGLLPQSANEMLVTGKSAYEAKRILTDAREMDKLGAFSIVLECIPKNLAKQITQSVQAITIGIGAGIHCDGQVLVINDMLGMDEDFKPKHVKRYAVLNSVIKDAVGKFIEDVLTGNFPREKHSFH